jgi:TPR repeat protein
MKRRRASFSISPKDRHDARVLLEDACEAYESGDLNTAVRYFRRSATLGSAEAKVNLGNLYSTGEGVAKDTLLAKQLYRSAFRQGSAYGATALGSQYRNEGKPKLAKVWYGRAAAMGEEWAREYLAELLD